MVEAPAPPDTLASDIGYFDESGVFQPLQEGQNIAPAPSFAALDIASLIPGGDVLASVLSLIKELFGDIESALKSAESAHPLNVLHVVLREAGKALAVTTGLLRPTWDLLTEFTVGSLYQSMLEAGMGLDTSTFDEGASRAMTTVDTMLGFAAILQVIGAGTEATAKAMLGGRWGPAVGKMLQELPQELGLSWVLGLTIEKAFEAALGNKLEEAILAQKQSRAPEWPVVRTLLRQHQIGPKDLDDRLKSSGFDDHWRAAISKLADAQLPLGDIQNGYLHGIISAADARKYIDELGFSEEHAKILEQMYIAKAETESSRFLVATARSLFRRQLITADQYRSVLESHNYPAKEIDDDIAAVKLEIENGRLELSVSTIKAEYLRGKHDASAAIMQLQLIGYNAIAAGEIVNGWDLPPTARQHGLSQARILSYYMSGVLSASQARTQLQMIHLFPETIDLLLTHPSATGGARQRQLTPALIERAFEDRVITQEELAPLLRKAGVPAEYVDYYVRTAIFRFNRQKPGAPESRQLSEAQIADAWSYGLMDEGTALNELAQLGFSRDNAELVLEIKNKGPFKAPQKPPFASLADAIAYLVAHGFAVHPPPDPLLTAAENMVAQAGYTFIPPPPSVPPPPL